MIESSPVSAITEKVLECNVCENRVASCDACGRSYMEGDEIVHISHDGLSYHFCSEKCHTRFWNLRAFKLVVPA
jgi:5-methylcytosine-specific restriction endonuclease McrA